MRISSNFRRGFSLIEVTIAIGIAAFCLIVIFALLPTGLNSNEASIRQTVAAGLAAGIVADLRAAPAGLASSPRYQIDPTTAGAAPALYLMADGSKAPGGAPLADYLVTVTFTQPGATKNATSVSIKIQWPAAAAKPSGLFEVWTAIDRN